MLAARRNSAWAPRVSIYLAGERRPPPAERLQVRGWLRSTPHLANGPEVPTPAWRLSVKSRRLLTVDREAKSGPLASLIESVRAEISKQLRERSQPTSGLLRALLMGDTSELDPALLSAVRRLGLGHLLAVSGLHLGMAVAVVWVALLPVSPAWRIGPAAVVVSPGR